MTHNYRILLFSMYIYTFSVQNRTAVELRDCQDSLRHPSQSNLFIWLFIYVFLYIYISFSFYVIGKYIYTYLLTSDIP